jgi:hypothetical protein
MEVSVFYKCDFQEVDTIIYFKKSKGIELSVFAFNDFRFKISNWIDNSYERQEITEQEFNEAFVKAMISLGFTDAYKLIIPALENFIEEYTRTKQN